MKVGLAFFPKYFLNAQRAFIIIHHHKGNNLDFILISQLQQA